MSPRAVGVRRPYAAVPDRVHAWVEDRLWAPVAGVEEQSGGMSPGCASRLRLVDGRRAFVKAVGPELNPGTPDLFRREAEVLTTLGPDARWCGLVDVLDEGLEGWVALLLDDVEGRHPDLSRAVDMDLLLAATDDLADELAMRLPAPPTRPAGSFLDWLPDRYDAWLRSLRLLDAVPLDVVGERWRRLAPAVTRRVEAVAATPPTRLVHFDVRDDNLLVRPDGSLVFLDWGAAGFGHGWQDPLLARLERVDEPWFDDSLARSPALRELGDATVTAWLAAFGCHLAWRDTVATDVNLPTLAAFRRRESARFLAAAGRRVDLGWGP